MPRVTLTNSRGTTQTNSGGCFGFAGRSGCISSSFRRIHDQLPQSPITSFKFDVSNQWSDAPQAGLSNPVPYMKWIAEESSWAKYIQGHNLGETIAASGSWVDMKTDIPGHCVIGAASALRLASHRKDRLIPFFNLAMQQGSNPAIALLVFYAMAQQCLLDFTVVNGSLRSNVTRNTTFNIPTVGTGVLSLGDDEVMRLSHVNPGLIYSFIDGVFEMKRNDLGREALYSTGSGYEQDILNSFDASPTRGITRAAEHSLPKFLLDRFHPPLSRRSLQRLSSASSMGSSTLARNNKHPIMLTSLLGWVATLSREYEAYGRFLGWEGR